MASRTSSLSRGLANRSFDVTCGWVLKATPATVGVLGCCEGQDRRRDHRRVFAALLMAPPRASAPRGVTPVAGRPDPGERQ
jgi:hypothetical protein